MTPKEKFQSLRHLILETPLDKQNIHELETKCDLYAEDIEQALTELEELKRDVKRYFELDYKLEFDSEEEAIEWRSLYYKLLKVGKEHV